MKPVTSSRDEYITACLEHATPMLRNLARKYHAEFDEFYQQAALVAFSCYEQALSKENPLAYIQASIQHRVLDEFRPRVPVHFVSLDQPCTHEGTETYLDRLIASPDIPEDTTRADQQINALYDAIKRLPLEEQQYLREVHHLNAFQPVPLWERRPDYHRTRNALRKGAYRRLRRDTALMQAMNS